MAELLSLPNELIQHIASFLPCSSALSLLRVDRQLRNICNDKVVFQSITKYDLERSLLLENGIELPETFWAESDAILANISLQETIRIAYAAERCMQALIKKDDTWTLHKYKRLRAYELGDWLPQMMALHHPAASHLKPENFLQLQGQLFRDEISLTMPLEWYKFDVLNVNFILSYTILAQLHMTGNGKQVKEPFDRFFCVNHATDPPITLRNGVRTDGDAIKSLRQRVRDYGSFDGALYMEQATALLPTLLLELAVHHLTPVQMRELPSPIRIPFSALMHMPPVFEMDKSPPFTDGKIPFGLCHLHKMVSPNFLSSGRWMGYCSDQRRALGRRRFDPPMHDIQIVARNSTKEESGDESPFSEFTVIDSRSRGTDTVGEFSLEGSVRRDGSVYIMKRYLSRDLSWIWKATITPFGIVGVWGGEDRFGGYFWIWKEEWR
jgi:hypothetical protein